MAVSKTCRHLPLWQHPQCTERRSKQEGRAMPKYTDQLVRESKAFYPDIMSTNGGLFRPRRAVPRG